MRNDSDTSKFLQAVFPDHAQHAIFANLNPPAHTRDWTRLDEERDCYWSIAAFPLEAKTNLGDDALHVVALAIDDVGTKVPAEAVERALGRPTAIVESSLGNFQWVYRLSKPVAIGDWAGFLGGVEARIAPSKPLEARGAQTLMRLPMGRNTHAGSASKPHRNNFAVRLVELNPGVSLDPDTIPRSRAAASGAKSSGGGSVRDIMGLMKLVPNNDDHYDLWEANGERCKAIAIDKEKAFEAFSAYSSRSEKHDAEETEARWKTFKANRTPGWELHNLAKAADPEGYAAWWKAESAAAFADEVEAGHPAEGGGYALTHADMAAAIVAAERGRLGWVSNSKGKRWAAFDAVLRRWVVEGHDEFVRAAVRDEVLAARVRMADDEKIVRRLAEAKWQLSVQSLLHLHADLKIPFETLDADPDMFGVPGYVVRLGLGVVTEESGTASHMVSRAMPVRPAPAGTKGVAWEKFLDEYTDGDRSLRRWWQCFCGYCLTGHTHEQTIVNVHGKGENGKSVFLDTIGEVMGPYHQRAGHTTFIAAHGGKHLSQVAGLMGARLVTVADVPHGAAWDLGLLKPLTGGGKFRAQFMREDWFEFEPTFKMIISCNEKLQLDAVDKGVRRRFLMVPATHDLEKLGKKPNKYLMRQLRKEHPAILRWMLDGWQDYDMNGLPECAVIERETKTYLDGADVWGQWLKAAITPAPGDGTRHRINDLWDDWNNFRHNEGGANASPAYKNSLSSKLQEAGIRTDRDNKGGYADGISVVKTRPNVF